MISLDNDGSNTSFCFLDSKQRVHEFISDLSMIQRAINNLHDSCRLHYSLECPSSRLSKVYKRLSEGQREQKKRDKSYSNYSKHSNLKRDCVHRYKSER